MNRGFDNDVAVGELVANGTYACRSSIFSRLPTSELAKGESLEMTNHDRTRIVRVDCLSRGDGI